MEFFKNLRRGTNPTYFFFPTIYAPGLRHFLMTEKITGWDITTKRDIMPLLPNNVQIPEVRLTPTAPRVEKRVSCLVSRYDVNDLQSAYDALTSSQEWLDWHNQKASDAMAEYEFRNAMANDPSPLSPFQPEK